MGSLNATVAGSAPERAPRNWMRGLVLVAAVLVLAASFAILLPIELVRWLARRANARD